MENIFEGMISEEELTEISEIVKEESGAGIWEKISSKCCPTMACTPPCSR